MTATLDNIRDLRAELLDDAVVVRFESGNAGMHHQLYVDGRLADWTDTPAQRRFVLPLAQAPRELAIAAVDAASRGQDQWAALCPERPAPPWVFRPRVPRRPWPPAARMAVLTDHATGRLDPVPVLETDLWPPPEPRWMFGLDAMGAGHFGFDDSPAAGFGGGDFGAGPVGTEGRFVDAAVSVAVSGTHVFVTRIIDPDGAERDGLPECFTATMPNSSYQ